MTTEHLAENAVVGGISAYAITVGGSILGLPYESLLLGMLGGVIGMTFAAPGDDGAMPIWRRWLRSAAVLLACGLFAGAFTRLAESLLPSVLPAGASTDALHVAVAVGLGIGAPIGVPLIRGWLKRLAERKEG